MRFFTWSLLLLFVALTLVLPVAVLAAEAGHGTEETAKETGVGEGVKRMGYGVGAGLAVGLAGIATGIAQARIGSAGIGAVAENPKLFGNVILLIAIPETVVLFGFVIALLIILVAA